MLMGRRERKQSGEGAGTTGELGLALLERPHGLADAVLVGDAFSPVRSVGSLWISRHASLCPGSATLSKFLTSPKVLVRWSVGRGDTAQAAGHPGRRRKVRSFCMPASVSPSVKWESQCCLLPRLVLSVTSPDAYTGP